MIYSRMPYRATRRDKKYLKLYRQGKSIGFTMTASLKAKGLIPRANGTRRVSNKYKGGDGSVYSNSPGSRPKIRSNPFNKINLQKVSNEYENAECTSRKTGKGPGCQCTPGSSNGIFKKITGSTECGPGLTCKYDADDTIEFGEPRYSCQSTNLRY